MNIESLKLQAKRLRKQLWGTGAQGLSSQQALEWVAQLHGFADWSNLLAHHDHHYFYARHEGRIGISPGILVAMSMVEAVSTDLIPDNAESADKAFGLVREGMARALWQIEAANTGAMRVQAELLEAIQRANGFTESLVSDERELARAFEAVNRSVVAKLYTGTITGGDRALFSDTYKRWRLAGLSCALQAHRALPPVWHLESLARAHVDVFGLAKWLLYWTPTTRELKAMDLMDIQVCASKVRTGEGPSRLLSKQLLLGMLGGENAAMTTERSDRDAPETISYQSLLRYHQMLDRAFPLIRVWQAWIELKPLLAQGADAFHRDRV